MFGSGRKRLRGSQRHKGQSVEDKHVRISGITSLQEEEVDSSIARVKKCVESMQSQVLQDVSLWQGLTPPGKLNKGGTSQNYLYWGKHYKGKAS